MKQYIENLIHVALITLQESNEFPAIPAFIQVEMPKKEAHGDFSSNIAMILAKATHKKPRDIAQHIIQVLPASLYVEKVEVAGPGFINFYLTQKAWMDVLVNILAEKNLYGCSKMGRGKSVLVESVSSNPTGPLHIGHGRHAVFGAVMANLLDAVGFKCYREYYINDAGRQVDVLTISVLLRYLALCGEKITYPIHAYHGDYIQHIAEKLFDDDALYFKLSTENLARFLPLTAKEEKEKDRHIDDLIEYAKESLGNKYAELSQRVLTPILADIKEDLTEFGVIFDNWVSERQIIEDGSVKKMLQTLTDSGPTFTRDGALWFKATQFGDQTDRLLVSKTGEVTYFANDAAYHLNKFERGFDIAMDIFSSSRHGYVSRLKGIIAAFGINSERLIHAFVQSVTLCRGHSQIQMSTRSGNFVSLRNLRQEVGNDAARFFYLMRKSEQHMDFDINLAKAKSNENPIYYVQYAYTRICSVFKQLAERKIQFDECNGIAHFHLLTEPKERQLLNTLSQYPDMIVNAALHYEPYLLTTYLRELAACFHAYYTAHPFIVSDRRLRDARLALIVATRHLLHNGCQLLGISTPESM